MRFTLLFCTCYYRAVPLNGEIWDALCHQVGSFGPCARVHALWLCKPYSCKWLWTRLHQMCNNLNEPVLQCANPLSIFCVSFLCRFVCNAKWTDQDGMKHTYCTRVDCWVCSKHCPLIIKLDARSHCNQSWNIWVLCCFLISATIRSFCVIASTRW